MTAAGPVPARAKAPGASVPVEPGTVEVAASVEVTWAIAP
jgi:uncharacterized protein YggE